MTKHSTLIILLFFSFSTLLHAQRRADSDTKSVQEATKLAKQAEKLWKDEKYIEAEKLYYKALSIYPLHLQLSEFAEKK
ncbi:MAG: hypothetical protein IPH34_11030 [Chitinophagaceae bacterium]|nr:hypothetical protein [Chitinophagaceae bacterium]